MSYQLYDENGYVADLASNRGFMDMVSRVGTLDSAPALKEFFSQGYTSQAEEVAKEVEMVIPLVQGDVQETLRGLLQGLQQVQDIAIITQ